MSTIIPLKEKRLMLTTLRSDDLKRSLILGFGVYHDNGWREEWTGESLDGIIPLDTLIAWALEQGYLRFDTDGLRRGERR